MDATTSSTRTESHSILQKMSKSPYDNWQFGLITGLLAANLILAFYLAAAA